MTADRPTAASRPPFLVRAATALLAAQAAVLATAARPGIAAAVDAFVPATPAAGRCPAGSSHLLATHPQAGPVALCTAKRCAAICADAEDAGGTCMPRPATGTYLVQIAGWLAGCRGGDV